MLDAHVQSTLLRAAELTETIELGTVSQLTKDEAFMSWVEDCYEDLLRQENAAEVFARLTRHLSTGFGFGFSARHMMDTSKAKEWIASRQSLPN